MYLYGDKMNKEQMISKIIEVASSDENFLLNDCDLMGIFHREFPKDLRQMKVERVRELFLIAKNNGE